MKKNKLASISSNVARDREFIDFFYDISLDLDWDEDDEFIQ